MAEVHPNTSPPPHSQTSPPSRPPAGTYVIQVPKDQTYRYPPPENARRYDNYTRRKPRRSRFCCCLCSLISTLFALIVLLVIASGTFYLLFRPESPDYKIDRIAVKGMNLTSPDSISPEFDVFVRAENGNRKIGIYYLEDSTVEISYRGIRLCNGVIPAFYQPRNNVTVFETVVKGDGVELARSDRKALKNAVAERSVPLRLEVTAAVKFKLRSINTSKFKFKFDCDLTVDQLTAQAKILHKDCSFGFTLW